MIQRIQTLYLFLAAVCAVLLLFLPLAVLSCGPEALPGKATLWGFDDPSAAVSYSGNWVNLAAALLLGHSCLASLVTIFLDRNRNAQRRLCVLQLVLLTVACGLSAGYLCSLPDAVSIGRLSPAAFLPVVAIVAVLLALRGIVRDEKLVRSLDRIR